MKRYELPTMFTIRGVIRKLGRRRLSFCVVLALFFLIALQIFFHPNVKDMLELHKCPACYGVSLCSDILQGPSEISISFDYMGRLGVFANIITTKNVFSGLLNDKRVIVKRLGHSSELHLLDKKICLAMGSQEDCGAKLKQVVLKVPNIHGSIEKVLNESKDFNEFRLRLCPSTEHVRTLFSPILPKVNGSNDGRLDNDGTTAHIWTLLLINPEPLFLQIMRAEDGWPVPHYLGACGRIAVTLHAGEPLVDFLHRSWPERAGLALQLLLAADRFTFSHPQFAFYLLDISSDNIVVNEKGKLSFVDLEHLVVVDRHPTYIPDTWNESHVSEVYDDCPGCNTFSSDSLCQHHISDHNHHVICEQLLGPGIGSSGNSLPGGLLHSIPSDIQKQYPQIVVFLNECSLGKGKDHIRSARRLRDTLNIASKESPLFGDQKLLQTWKYF
ncbi:Divergent protein kinase domain 2A [Frankliniella fusca]|uniref:Divergent protein kinase domain 2A n=1 Tax=Frankliniella fusca TaxID=407009 RepID=A0AAE1I617_9NEOP|nr:Divergent protein kinase domain 2A [Frankliniella fusca]